MRKPGRGPAASGLKAAAVLIGLLFAACSAAGPKPRDTVSAEAGKFLAAGDFEKAIVAFEAPLKRKPRDKRLAADFARTVEGVKRAADGTFARGDYGQAARIYRILLDHEGDFRPVAAALTFDRKRLETAARSCRVAAVDGEARQEMKVGEYAKAIELYATALKELPGDVDLAARSQKAVGEVKAIGDVALAGKDYAQAGRVHALLLKELGRFEALGPGPGFSRQDLAKALAASRDGLTKAGLEAYRKGDLAAAIAAWESLLAFDPDNAEIRKAVETARVQLDAIKKK